MSKSSNRLFPLFGNNGINVENVTNSKVSVYTGDINGIPPEQFAALAEELGITKAALKNFFNIILQHNVVPEDYDHTLRQIAERYHNLLKELTDFQADDPQVKYLLTQAEQVLQQGDFDQAEDLINRASEKDLVAARQLRETAEKRLISAAKAKAKNGYLNYTRFKYVIAAAYYQDAAEVLPQHCAELIAANLNQAGLAMHKAGLYEKAEPLYRQALQIRENTLGANHPAVADTLNDLAELYRILRRNEQVEPLLKRALQISEQALGPDHYELINKLNCLASFYVDKKRYKQAESLLQRALQIGEHASDRTSYQLAHSLNSLAEMYYRQERYDRARPLLERVSEIIEKNSDPEDPKVAHSLNNLATVYKDKKLYDLAEHLYRRAVQIMEKTLGSEHPGLAKILENLGDLYSKQGFYDKAEPLFQRALQIAEKGFGSEHVNLITILVDWARLYEHQALDDQADPLYERALQIGKKNGLSP